MFNLKTTDKLLLILGFSTLVVSGFLFFFVNIEDSTNNRTNPVGEIISRSGDVRLKFASSQNWQSARYGEKLVYKDTIFSGENSSVAVKFGNSTMEIGANSLIVLRKKQDSNVFDLTYGSMTAIVARGEKVYLKNTDGKEIEMNTKQETGFVIRRNTDGSLDVEVQSGEALSVVDGQKRKLSEKQRLKVSDKGAELIQPDLVITTETPVIYSNDSEITEFTWAYSPAVKQIDQSMFQLEFSQAAAFQEVLRKETVEGQDSSKMRFTKSTDVFYRVRDKSGTISNTEKFKFVLMNRPTILSPDDEQEIYKNPDVNTNLTIRFTRPQESINTHIQVSKSSDFSQTVYDEILWGDSQKLLFEIGDYHIRIRSGYPLNNFGHWTSPRRISVKTPTTKFYEIRLADHILIPNDEFGDLAGKELSLQRQELQQRLPELSEYFTEAPQGHRVEVKFKKRKNQISLKGSRSWPQKYIHPGNFKISYRIRKPGYRPSKWSSEHAVSIQLQAPTELNKQIDVKSSNKWLQHQISWSLMPLTPGYQLHISEESEFELVETRNVKNPELLMDVQAGQAYYWKVRTINARGTATSLFSDVYEFNIQKTTELLVKEVRPAENKKRNIAVEDNSQINDVEPLPQKAESYAQLDKRPPRNHKWWLWAGYGFNYSTYNQDQTNKLSFVDSKPNNQYIEIGYIGQRGFGGVGSIKSTPGEILIAGKNVDNPKYDWRTVSLEGVYSKPKGQQFLQMDLEYGARVGAQFHSVPFVEINANKDLSRHQVDVQTASLGFLSSLRRGRTKYHMSMRYQMPFSTKINGSGTISLNPELAFDGSIGASHHFAGGINIGWFWSGQYHKYKYKFENNGLLSQGTLSLFYSNMDLRLGYEF